MFLIIRYKLKKQPERNKVKIKRDLDVFNKLLNGVNKTNIKPTKLLTKKRGYLKMFSQKLFIQNLNSLSI
jgi:hypothetical protein